MFAEPTPPRSITDDEADVMMEPHVDTERLEDLRKRVAAARAIVAQNDNAPAAMPRDEPFFNPGWYRVVGPNGSTVSFASGTADEAEEYHNLGPDGWTLDRINHAPDIQALDAASRTPGAMVMGRRLVTLDAEVADWREERSSAYR